MSHAPPVPLSIVVVLLSIVVVLLSIVVVLLSMALVPLSISVMPASRAWPPLQPARVAAMMAPSMVSLLIIFLIRLAPNPL